jgi:hypothetical protein
MFVHFLSVAFIWKSRVDHDHSILPGTGISIIRRGKMRTNVLLTLLYTHTVLVYMASLTYSKTNLNAIAFKFCLFLYTH